MLDPLLNLLIDGSYLGSLFLGLVIGLIFGLMPGLNGRLGLVLMLPFVIGMDPWVGMVLLVAMHSVVHTASAIPAILLGVPTSSSEAATVIDGYPMVRKGEAGAAIGATFAASALGGVIGALALLAFLPLARPLIAYLGSAEVAMLGLIGLTSIAALAGRSLARGFVVAALGVLCSTVGADDLTGSLRYTFDQLELWDGIGIGAVVTGLFVLPEILMRQVPLEGEAVRPRVGLRDVLRGCWQTLQHGWLVFRTSVIGVLVGFVPGIGAGVAVWLAYGHATQTTKSEVPYGEGAVAGVIAAETANNSKEGGALAPTLLFGVPGTSSMGILLAAFAIMGIEVGPQLVTARPGFVESVAWVVLLANVAAVPVCLAVAPAMARVSLLRRSLVSPPILIAASLAAISVRPDAVTLLEILFLGLLGIGLVRHGWPRAPFVLGFVMGPLLEKALSRTITVYGWEALERPGVLLLGAMTAILLFVARRRLQKQDRRLPSGLGPAWSLTLPLAAILSAAALFALDFHWRAAVLPMLTVAVGAAGLLSIALRSQRVAGATGPLLEGRLVVGFLLFLLACWLVGPPLATGLFVLLALRYGAAAGWLASAVTALLLLTFAGWLIGDSFGLIQPLDPIWRTLGIARGSA